jgi:hypothetical protein
VALAVLIQAVAWSKGRNEDRSLGWLPVYRAAPQQAVLDRWVRDSLGTSRVLSLEGYPQAWDVYASAIAVERGRPLGQLRSVQYDERLALARGAPLDVAGYDVVMMDPASPLFEAAWASLPSGRRIVYRDPRLLIATTER